MKPDLALIKKLFVEVLAKPTAAARRAHVDEVCGQDPEMHSCLLEMLEAHEEHATPVPDASPHSRETNLAPHQDVYEPGTVIAGTYKIIELIGEGGMGVVYKARRVTDFKMEVALKVIKPGMDSRQVLARFKNEQQALAMMNHENIAKVLDAGMTDQGRPFFVMELVKGLPLTKFCDESKLPVGEPVAAGPPTFSYRLSKVIRKHRGKVLVASLLAATVLVGAIVSTIGWTMAYREKVRANMQTAIANEVIRFLTDDLLARADPELHLKPGHKFISNMTVKEALDQTAGNARWRFAEKPLVQAAFYHALGKAYMGLGDYKAAHEQLEQAEKLRRNTSGRDDPDRLSSLHELGWLLLKQGQLDQAELILKETTATRWSVLGAKHPDTCKTDYIIGILLQARDKNNEARQVYEDVLTRQIETLGLRHPDTLNTK